MNPVDEFLETREKQANVKREKEHQLWNTWEQSGRKPQHLEPLLQAFNPVVNAKVREWKAPRVNESAFKAELHTHMIKAFETYDPNRGASLRTHVEGRLQKAKRYNAKNQNFAYMPEEQIRFIGKIQQAHDQLSDEYGRAPTNTEIAKHVNSLDPKFRLTEKRVGEIRANQKADRPGSLWTFDPVARTANREQEVLNLINAEITGVFPNPDERAVFEHVYGLNGRAKVTGTNDLAKKLGKSPSQISRIKSSVGAKVKSYL